MADRFNQAVYNASVKNQVDEVQDVITVGENHICAPLSSLHELINWEPDSSIIWPEQSVPKAPITSYKIGGFAGNCHLSQDTFSPYPRIIGHTAPKTIYCHDYKGGYREDKHVGGCRDEHNYIFFHWAGIDKFIYFSHHLVTIPPLGWLNAGHRHGVSVLGTFITEHDSGKILWEKITADTSLMSKVIENLVLICSTYHFDGYLLNIENDVPNAEVVVEFVRKLKVKLVEQCGKHTEVIWYDAVTYPTGKLDWQNKLNDKNKKFFDHCDGIFLNYVWTLEDLAQSAAIAGSRQQDVFVGIDVFGRGCFGGGGFNTDKALARVHAAGLSVAFFAPAWTHETCPVGFDYFWREIFFWHRIWKYLYIHGPAGIPFSTSFSIGRGFKKFFRGRPVLDSPFYNLSEQEIQITTPYCVNNNDGEIEIYSTRCLRVFFKDAYRGGSCLIISRPNDLVLNQHCFIRLFACEFKSDKLLKISFSYKIVDDRERNKASLSLILLVEDDIGKLRRYVLTPDVAYRILCSLNDKPHIKTLFMDPYIRITRSTGVFEDSKWLTNYFDFDLGSDKIIEIGVIHFGEYDILLGDLSIKYKDEDDIICTQA